MKTLKKVITLCLMVVLSVTLLTACSGTDNPIVNSEFTVTYDLNTADSSAQFVPNEIVKQVNKYYNPQKITEPSKPIRKGYDFGGWYYDKECTKLVKYKWESFDHDVTLYAKWFERNSLTVSFYCDDAKVTEPIQIPMELNEKYYKGDIIKGSIIRAGYEAFEQSYKANLKDRALLKNFVCTKQDVGSYNVLVGTDIKVNDELLKYAEKVENHYIINFTVGIQDKTREISFLNKTTQVCVVPSTKDGFVDFNKAYKNDANGNKDTNIQFETDKNGRRTMPKAVVEKYEKFSRWQVSLIGVEGNKPFEYYNKLGQLIDKNGNLIDEKGNIVTEDKAVYFVDYRKIENITKIACLTTLNKYKITYQLWIPELDDKGDILKVQGKTVYLDEKKITLDVAEYQYDAYINKLLDAKVKEELEAKNLSTIFKLISWKYAENYPQMNVKATDEVSPNHQLKHDIVIRTSLDVRKEVVRFQKGKDEFFNTKNTNISTTVEYGLNDVNNWLLNPDLPEAFDIHNMIGGMYFVKPGISVPLNSPTFIKTAEMNAAERDLLKQQYTLIGFCLSEHKDMGINAPLVITYDSVTKKLALKNNQPLKTTENSNEIVLKPIFKRNTNTKVIIDISADKNIIIPQALQNEIYAQLDTFSNGTNIESYKNDIKLKGHKFLKWEVVATPFDNLPLVNKGMYLHVEFNNKYPVIGTTTIKPVFTIDDYTLTFVDTFDKDIFTLPEDKIVANIKDKFVTNQQIDKVIAYQGNLVANIPVGENSENYEFDDWYTSDLKDLINRDISLTEFINSAKDGQVGDYKFNLSRNITFKARFIPINYKVQFMEFNVVSDKLSTTYKASTVAKNCVFTFKGINAKYTDNLANVYESEIYNYQPVEEIFNYVSNNGIKKNFVIGWYYYAYGKDALGNIDKSIIIPQDLNTKSSISKETVPFVLSNELVLLSAGTLPAGYKLVENNTIKVFPKLAEFNVTIDANGGKYNDYDELGNLKGYKTKIEGIKGGMFGFDIPTGKDDKGNPINKLNNKPGYDIDSNYSYYVINYNKEQNKSVNVYYKDSHYQNDVDRLRITAENSTFYINWKASEHNVKVYFYDINGVCDDSKTLELIGTVEKIYRMENVEGEMTPVVYDVKKLVDITIGSFTPRDSYYAYIYEMKNGVETYIYDGYYQNATNMFENALVDREVHCKLKYNNLHLSLDANGGYYAGSNIVGDPILESYIDKDSALTMNKAGKLTHGEDAYSAYVTKNQENMPGEKIDQGAPLRDNYVFAGFATKPNAKIGVDKFYYGYRDHSDIRDFDKIFSNTQAVANTCWLGDITKFMEYATGDLIVVEYNSYGVIVNIRMNKLYAQWIPVKTQVEYYKTDKKTQVNVQTDIFGKFGGKVAGINGTSYSDLLMPEKLILNPYKFANNTKDKDLVSWVTEKGSIVDDGLKVGKHNTFDFNTATIKGDAQNGFYYLATCKVYESLKTGINIKYRVTYEGKQPISMDGIDYLVNDMSDLSKYPLELKKDTDGKYYVFRQTYAIGDNNRVIDSLFNNQAYQVGQFDQGNIGDLKQSGQDFYYEYSLYAKKYVEKLPVLVDTVYKNACFDRNDVNLNNTLNDPMLNPYYDEAKMANKVTGEMNYFKSQMVRVVVEDGKYVTQRVVWKSDNGTVMEPDINDLTKKNLSLGDNSNVINSFVGNKKPRVEKINGVSTIILETVVKGEWVAEPTNSIKVQTNYLYDKSVDVNGNESWTKLLDEKGMDFVVDLSGIVNETNEFIQNKKILDRPSQPIDSNMRLTWKLGSEIGDDIDTVDENKKIVNTIKFSDVLERGMFVSNISGSEYVLEMDLYEAWIIDATK